MGYGVSKGNREGAGCGPLAPGRAVEVSSRRPSIPVVIPGMGLPEQSRAVRWRWRVLEYSPQSRAERLIAAGRVVLAASALLALWLDPTGPVKAARAASLVLTVYVVYITSSGLLGSVPGDCPLRPDSHHLRPPWLQHLEPDRTAQGSDHAEQCPQCQIFRPGLDLRDGRLAHAQELRQLRLAESLRLAEPDQLLLDPELRQPRVDLLPQLRLSGEPILDPRHHLVRHPTHLSTLFLLGPLAPSPLRVTPHAIRWFPRSLPPPSCNGGGA
jgi:hypothetical protein